MGRETYSEVPDRGLAEALLERGDEKAFRELYRRHTPRLTWLRAAQYLDRFRWESSLSTWLSGIGLNVCRDLWRKRNGRDLEWNGSAEPPVLAPRTDERIDLERAITLLPVGYRTVLILHDLEGFTHDEIGEQLGIAAGTSKSQLSCARRAVRAMLNPEPRRMDGRDA